MGGELAKEETTIAGAFQARGYRTGIFGKWRYGEEAETPEYRRAFEEAWKTMLNKRPQGGLGVVFVMADALAATTPFRVFRSSHDHIDVISCRTSTLTARSWSI